MPEICVDQSCPAQKSGEAHSHDPEWNQHNPRTRTIVGRCNAWYYPGKFSWDIELRSRSDGKRCVLGQGHPGMHQLEESTEQVDHPSHYGGKDNPYEAIKVLSAWRLGFLLGNCVKHISRAGKKDPSKLVEDLKKARWYLDEAIQRLERGEELF